MIQEELKNQINEMSVEDLKELKGLVDAAIEKKGEGEEKEEGE